MNFEHETQSMLCSRAELRALAEHTSKDETRPHVNAVLFDPGKGIAAATDGHRLVRCTFEAAAGEPMLVPRAAIVTAAKLLGAEDDARISFGRGEKSLIVCPDADVRFKPVEATFPPIESVIPPPLKHGVPTAISARFLRGVQLVAKAAGGGQHEGMAFYLPKGPLEPIVATRAGWLVVIMPLRWDFEEVAWAARTNGA